MWRVGFFGKNQYTNLINEEWRVEKSKISINVEGGFLFCGGWNFLKSVRVWAPRLLERWEYSLRVSCLWNNLCTRSFTQFSFYCRLHATLILNVFFFKICTYIIWCISVIVRICVEVKNIVVYAKCPMLTLFLACAGSACSADCVTDGLTATTGARETKWPTISLSSKANA